MAGDKWRAIGVGLAVGAFGLVAACGGTSPAASGGQDGGTWGPTMVVAGTLNQGHGAGVLVMSCPKPGDCSAGGYFTDAHGFRQAMLVDEAHGTWAPAIEVPGTAAINKYANGFSPQAVVGAISCPAVGTCGAVGYVSTVHGTRSYVVAETEGTWGSARTVGRGLSLDSISCPTAGNCTAGGSSEAPGGPTEAVVLAEVDGRWRAAEVVPGSAALSRNPRPGLSGAAVTSVSCAGVGACAAGGFYGGAHGQEAFLASERSGRWGEAVEVPGTSALNAAGNAQVTTIDCPRAGGCTAVGFYATTRHAQLPFVVGEEGGTWRPAVELPGMAELVPARGQQAAINALSCPQVAECGAGGVFYGAMRQPRGFVASESRGTWATEVIAAPIGQVNAISCAAPGECSAGGSFKTFTKPYTDAVVLSEVRGIWGAPVQVAGISIPLHPGAIGAISCSAPGACAAGGSISFGTAIVLNQTPSS